MKSRFHAALIMTLAAMLVMSLASCASKKGAGGEVPSGPFTLSSPTAKGGELPVDATCRSPEPQSPLLTWSNPPAGTRSFALKAYDLDANHALLWYVFNIAPQTRSLPSGLPDTDTLEDGATQFKSWLPPCAKEGPTAHRIQFVLYALDTVIDPGTSDISGTIDMRATAAIELVLVARR